MGRAGGRLLTYRMSKFSINVLCLVCDGIRCWFRRSCWSSPRRRSLGVDVSPYRVSVDSQLPRHPSNGHPLKLGLLHRLPSLLLQERRPPRLEHRPGCSRRGPAAPPAGPDSCPPALSPRPWRNRRGSSRCTPGWNGQKYTVLPRRNKPGFSSHPVSYKWWGFPAGAVNRAVSSHLDRVGRRASETEVKSTVGGLRRKTVVQPAAESVPPRPADHRRTGLRPPVPHRGGTDLRRLQPSATIGAPSWSPPTCS